MDEQKNNKCGKEAQNVALPQKIAQKSDRIFIHQEKNREEPEMSNQIE
ncbi:MAG: hypothetical protein IKU45_04145 [Clostridia bacterium]|nr:hypothetical protein [Clostridia bacterium]